MANNDDQRAAAGMLASLSGFIISASLAMLAIDGALFVFVLGNRIVGCGYLVVSLGTFASFVLSIVSGGWGVTTAAEKLAVGAWQPSIGGGQHFHRQAGLAFLGLAFFVVSVLLSGTPKETEVQRVLRDVTARTGTLQSSIDAARESDAKLSRELEAFSKQLATVEQSLNARVDRIETQLEQGRTDQPPPSAEK